MVMSMMSENSDRIVPPGSIDSPYADEACNVEVMNLGGNFPLKKGPWTSVEDAILVEYVTKHGEGNWNSVQKHSGLARCGKSCRLRWANHLRPDLKKGAFTPEEERRIIELHAKMGNKWARMAAELPGRTDNEIKNYWNTRIKRQQRAGLPIYPPDISSPALTESSKGNMSAYSDENPDHPDFLPINGIDIIPTIELKSFEFNQRFYSSPPPPPPLLDIPTHSISNETLLPAINPTKRLRQSDSLFVNSSDGFSHGFTGCVNYDALSFGICSDYDENLTPPDVVLPVSYAQLNGNSNGTTTTSSSELPSLQMGSSRWSPLSSSPPTDSCVLSTRNSGLLDAVLQESKYLKVLKNNNDDNLGRYTHVKPVEEEHGFDLHETEEWQPFHDLNSHFDYSDAPSMFSTIYTSVGETSLVEEPPSFHTIEGNKVKQEVDGIIATDGKVPIDMLFSRPDLVLASN